MTEVEAPAHWTATLRHHRRSVAGMALLFLLAVALIGSLWYGGRSPRAILVEATTGALTITLTSELSGKVFQNAQVCRRLPPSGVDLTRTGAPLGCPARSHRLESEAFATALPIGTSLQLFTGSDRFVMRVLSVPDAYRDTDVGRLVGGGVTLSGDAVGDFGSLGLTGLLVIGASPGETDRIPLTEGSYQINGPTPASIIGGFERQILLEGTLRAGAHLFFCERQPGWVRVFWPGSDAACHNARPDLPQPLGMAAGEAQVQIAIPDRAAMLMSVTAISAYRPVDLALHYFRTDRVLIGPGIVDALAKDPVIVFLATLSGSLAVLELALRLLSRLALGRGRD